MDVFGIFFGLLFPVLIIGGIVAAIVALARRNAEEPSEPGIGTIRRLFFYGLAFVALMLTTSGVTLLLSQTLDIRFGRAILRDDAFRIAYGLAATIVGLPIWLLLWRAAERSLQQYPAERGTLGRKSYMYLVLGVSTVVVAVFLVQLVQGILAPARFNIDVIAPVLVWGALWGMHWVWESREGQPSPISQSVRRLYTYITSTYGLVLLAVGTGLILGRLLNAAYDALFTTAVLGTVDTGIWAPPLQDAIALAVVGAVWWWFHWHWVSARDAASVLRQAVIYLIAIFGGLVVVVSGSAAILLTSLLWVFDREAATPAASHFDFVPAALASIVVAGGVWRYHSAVVLHEAAVAGTRLVSAQRTYRYLTAAVGLGTLAVGLTVLFGLILGLVIPGARGDLTGARWWAGPLATVLTLIAVGGPLWWYYWSRQQTTALKGVPGEREALSRRIFIFAVFGVAVLATLGALSTFLILVLQPLFEGRFTAQVLDGGKWALGIVLTAGTISVYYWQVLREDRQALAVEAPARGPAPAALRAEITALAPTGAIATVNAIAARLGAPIALWRREDAETAPEVSDADIEAVAEQVRASTAGKVMVVIDAGGVRVVPFSA